MRSACIHYVQTACKRWVECYEMHGFDTEAWPCPFDVTECPDLMFSEGSTWTIESLYTCSQAWIDMPCVDAADFEYPDCVPPGTGAPGTPCVFGSQCDSSLCLKGFNDLDELTLYDQRCP